MSRLITSVTLPTTGMVESRSFFLLIVGDNLKLEIFRDQKSHCWRLNKGCVMCTGRKIKMVRDVLHKFGVHNVSLLLPQGS